jgi:AcrR family transcriptional regulator
MTEQPGLRERKKQQTREAITAAAARLFAEVGYTETTVADVAVAANFSTNTVFNYFPTKEDLFFSQFVSPEETLVAALHERADGSSLEDVLTAQLAAQVLALIAPDTPTPHTAARQILSDSPQLRVHARILADRRQQTLAQALGDELDTDDLTASLAAAHVLSAYGALAAHARRGAFGGDSPERQRTNVTEGARIAVKMIMHGIAGMSG